MNLKGVIFLCVFALSYGYAYAKDCSHVKRTNSKLICYYSKLTDVDHCYCTHIILPQNSDVKHIEILKKKISGAKILLTVNEFNEGLVNTVKENHIDGLELNLRKLTTKDDITEFISTVRTKLGNDLFLALSIPPKTELLAKYYDFKALAKHTDLYILQTSFLGASKNVTFHPSRLSGLWDMQNTDSVVDLVIGLGAPLSRLVITAPVQAFQFSLQDDSLTTPGSPALQLKSITRKDLCELMKNKEGGSWTLERDQDQAGPYIFRNKEWVAFEDATSMDIKAKYTRVRGVAGLALKDLSQDLPHDDNEESICNSLLTAAYIGLSRQTRAPRQAVLRSLEREILLEAPAGHHLATVNVSPYRITRIVDVEGHVHSIRKDTRTEFECSRQGYFVHPHSCGRFYRCVKFDQLVDEFSVFEFDCPAGLVFDERVEVCVWPGNLPDGAPCHGSSEIAPVPRNRFDCPGEQGYYADPENCRWFFACLDHGKSGLTAYEFRCPFGLVFDEKRLLCEWPWLVPTCGSGYISGLQLDSIEFYGGAAKSTIIPGNHGASKIGHIQIQPQVVSSGAHLLDTYDGLGSLGAIALGGYNGDLNLLKENIQLHSGYNHLGSLAHVGGGYQSEFGAAGLSSGSQNLNQAEVYQEIQHSVPLKVTETELQGQKYSGSLDYNYQYANEAAYKIQPVAGNVGVVDKQTNDAVLLNNANLKYGATATSSSYANKLSHNIAADLSTRGESVLTAVPVEKTLVHFNVVTPKPDFYSLLGGQVDLHKTQSSGTSYSSFNQHHTPSIVTEYKAQEVQLPVAEVQQTVVALDSHEAHSSGSSGSSYSSFNQHHTPLVQYEQKLQPIVTEYKAQEVQQLLPVAEQTVVSLDSHKTHSSGSSGSSYSSFNQHHTPSVQYEQKLQPVVTEYKTQEVQQLLPVAEVQQTVVSLDGHKAQASGSSYSSFNQHHTPSVQYEQKLQPVVTEYKTQEVQQVLPVAEVQQTVLSLDSHKTQSSGSSYSSFNQHHTPSVQYEQKLQPIVTEYKAQEVQQVLPVAEVQQTVVSLNSHKAQSSGSSYSSFNQHHTPSVQYEQKLQPIITEYKSPVAEVKQSYSSSYNYQTPVVHQVQKVQPVVQYQTPAVHYQENVQPIVTEIKTPVAKVQQSGYSSSYHYQAPAVHYQEKVQPIVTEVKAPVIQQEIKQYQYQAPAVHYQENVQPIVTEIKTPVTKVQQSGYSSSYHYQAPAVHYQEKVQPIVTEVKAPVIQQEIKQYQYQAPAVHYQENVQPIVTEIKTPVAKVQQSGYSSSYHYQAPAVHYEQKVQQPIITEIKTPVVQQYQQPIVTEIKPLKQTTYSSSYHYQAPQEIKVQPLVEIKTQPQEVKHTYSSSYQYQTPVQQPIVTEIKAPVIQQEVKQYQYQQPLKQTTYSSSYHYQAPQEIKYEKVQPTYSSAYQYQTPVVQKVQIEKQTVVPLQEVKHTSSYSSGYQYQAPVQEYKQVVQPLIIQKEIVAEAKQTGYSSSYHYQAPEEPAVQQIKYEQPIVQKETYHQVPQVQYEQKQEAKSHSQFYGVQHNVQQQPQIIETVSVTPKYETVSVTPQYINHQYYNKRVHEVKLPVVEQPSGFVSVTPKYETISYEGRIPVQEEKIIPVKAYQTYTAHSQTKQQIKTVTEAPYLISSPKQIYKAPEVYVSTTPKYAVFQEYVQPKQQIVYTTPKPKAYLPPKQIYVSSTPKYQETIEIKKPASPTIVSQYEYVNPEYANYESKLNLNFDHFNSHPSTEQYHTQTAFYSAQEPQVIPVQKYQTDFVVSTPRPTFISTIAPVVKQTPTLRTKVVALDKYKTYDDGQYFVSTPKQFYVSTPAPPALPPFRYYDSRLETAAKNEEYIVSTEAPIVTRKKIASTTTPIPLDIYEDYSDVNYGSQYLVEVKPSTFKPKVEEYLVQTTPMNYYYEDKVDTAAKNEDYIVSTEAPKIVRPVVTRKKIASTTTPIPLDIYEDYSDVNYGSQYLVEVKPSTFKPTPMNYYYEDKVQSTIRPILRKKIVSTTTETTKEAYETYKTTSRPIVKKKKIIVTTSTSPAPASTDVGYDYDDYVVVSSAKPKYESVKITPRPKAKGKTIVRVNDFHPFLTTKLGAQCTCVSNTVKLRKQNELPENVPVTKLTKSGPGSFEDYEEPGVYVVGNSDAGDADEDYEYELKKVTVTTKTPEVRIKSTTNAIQPAPTPEYTLRRRLTTARPTIEVTSVSAKKFTSRTRVEELFLASPERSKKQKIVEAVNEGLSLVKSTVKSAVKEAIAEENRNFDRYGPGGWRSRGETLQGSTDCKREGLFRHPTQCNKFYACRWDCTKQRYTLHVFNCPVHLTFDTSQGACNWPSKGPACTGNTLLPSS